MGAKKLVRYLIESDSVILLEFSDASSERVSPDRLNQFLSGRELARVQRALQLKRRFIRRILPPWAKIALGASLMLATYTGSKVAAWYGVRPMPASAAPRPAAVVTHSAEAPLLKPETATVPAPAPTINATPAVAPETDRSDDKNSGHDTIGERSAKFLHKLKQTLFD